MKTLVPNESNVSLNSIKKSSDRAKSYVEEESKIRNSSSFKTKSIQPSQVRTIKALVIDT